MKAIILGLATAASVLVGGVAHAETDAYQAGDTVLSITQDKYKADLRFGQTILIASGENAINSRAGSKTPLLGSVPVLGKLFSNSRKSQSSTSLLILLTLRPQGSEQLPHADEVERELFRIRKDQLLEDLDADVESRFHRFIPDHDAMSYKLENPARRGEPAYLSRTGAMSPTLH